MLSASDIAARSGQDMYRNEYAPTHGGAPTMPSQPKRRGAFLRRRQDRERREQAAQERSALASQLHDDLGGVLTALSATLAVAIERDNAGETASTLLTDAVLLADAATAAIRRVGSALRPPLLEQMGFWAAIEWQLRRLAARGDLHTSIHVDARLEDKPLSEFCEPVLFRAICEALTNVHKHARATRVMVRMFEFDGFLMVCVIDDGVGMQGAPDHEASEHFDAIGLICMREQLARIGGSVYWGPAFDAPDGPDALANAGAPIRQGHRVCLVLPMEACYED